MASKEKKIALRAVAKFNNEHSNVKKLKILDAKINETRQEIQTEVEMKALLHFYDVEYLPISVCELDCRLTLIINLTHDDLLDILNNKGKMFLAELYVLSKDVEIVEREYISVKDSLSSSDVLVNLSLSKEIDRKLNEINYAIEVLKNN